VIAASIGLAFLAVEVAGLALVLTAIITSARPAPPLDAPPPGA
jgi:hypothetical protein